MAVKTHPIFMSFSSGEISPKMEGRIDLERSAAGCNKMQNFFCTPQGGAQADPGSRFVAAQGDETQKAILIPFVYGAQYPYVIEAGDEYFRFFKDGEQITSGGTAYEISTPYEAADLPKLRWIQTDFWLLLFHPDYAPRVLQKTTDTSWSLDLIDFYDGPYEDAINTPDLTPSAATGAITLTAGSALFLPGHVGTMWRIAHTTEWGFVLILSVTSPTTASAMVVVDLDGSGTAAAWYREGAWSDVNGWPSGACFHEGRLLCFGSPEWPNTVWASKTRHFDVFSPGTEDDDAYIFEASDVDVLRWMKSGKYLAMGAYSGEATAKGGGDIPITPTNPPLINTETTIGSANVDSVKAGRSIVYLQRAGKKVLEFAYDYASDAYLPNDLTIISDHLMELGLTSLSYQQEPVPIIWGLRSDGALLGCTFDKQQKIVGWHEHITDGEYESKCCVPTTGRDEVWVTVKRTIGGADRRFIERFDPTLSVHSGLSGSGSSITLAHLVGKTVAIVGDGAVYHSQVVPVGGVVTISPAATEIYAGLPYTPILITNRPEVQVQGTSQGLKKRWSKIRVRVIGTSGLTVNGQVVPVRTSDDEMDTAVPTTTGDIVVENIGWDEDARITITQPNPLPAYIVAIFGDLITGDA